MMTTIENVLLMRFLPVLLIFCLATDAIGSDGGIDLSFGTAGIGRAGITDAVGSLGSGPVVQPDGKILVCDTRTTTGGSGSDFFVARFNANGTLDNTFSFDGKVTIDFDGGTGSDLCTAIALQSDGKIVVAGSTNGASGNHDFAVARLNTDGTLDMNGFGTGTGKTIIAFDLGGSNDDDARGLAILPNGKIIVAGTVGTPANGTDFGIVRLNSDGSRDNTFNFTGRVTFGFDLPGSMTKNDVLTAIALDAAGNILVSGYADKSPSTTMDSDFAIARLLPSGQLDPNFDADGRATVAFDLGGANGGHNDAAFGMTVQRNGDIVLVGGSDTSSNSTTNFDVAVARLSRDGSLDNSFGSNGKSLVSFDLTPNGVDVALGAVEQSNGKLVLAGYSLSSPQSTVAGIALRFNADGGLDNDFGTLGKQVYGFGLTNLSSQLFRGVALQGTEIIASGGAVAAVGTDDFVLRVNTDLVFAAEFE